MIKFFKLLICPHKKGTLLAIGFDGVSTYRCNECGKLIRIGL